jgi:ADP-ribose pyrophosphatase
MTDKTFEILDQARVYNGFFKIDAYHLTSTGIDAPYVREVFQRGNSAAVLAYDPAMDAVLLIEELRPGCVAAGLAAEDCYSLGPIAGSMEKGEDALSTVVRESVEEAGVAIDGDQIFGPRRTMPSPGGSSEIISHFVALSDLSGVTDGQRFGLGSEAEATVVRIMPRVDAEQLLDTGICNGLTATLLTYLQSLIARNEIVPTAASRPCTPEA